MPRRVVLVPHDPRWSEIAARASDRIRHALGAALIDLHHIGSSAIPEIDRHLLFRDYLISHPETARAYGKLKDGVAARFQDDTDACWNAKGPFIP